MPAMEPLCRLIGIDPKNLSIEENILLEAELFLRILNEITEMFKARSKEYYRLMRFNIEMENAMIDSDFIRLLIQDILESEIYDIAGIACYTQMPEDIIHDIILKSASYQLMMFPRKLIELHRSIRPDLYKSIIKKIF